VRSVSLTFPVYGRMHLVDLPPLPRIEVGEAAVAECDQITCISSTVS
jgi:hypothetical protein